MTFFVLAVLALVLGSVPSGFVLVCLFLRRDIRDHGSGNIGASNVASAGGPVLGVAVAVLDMLKGVVPVAIGRWVGLDGPELAVVALAAVLGHDFSLFLRLRGGKGVATTFGVALVLSPPAALLSMAMWPIAAALSRYASVASLVALAALPVLLAITRSPSSYVLLTGLLFLLALAKHWENVVRLIQGTEPTIGRRNPASGGEPA